MNVSARHTVTIVVIAVAGLTAMNIILFRQTRRIRTGNRTLILQNDSIQSVRQNLEKRLVNSEIEWQNGYSLKN